MDRQPKPAPFAVGTRLKYTGTDRISEVSGEPILAPGIEAVVVETRPGSLGTLRWLDLDDDDEPLQDTTIDGYSVVETRPGRRRIAFPDRWQVVDA